MTGAQMENRGQLPSSSEHLHSAIDGAAPDAAGRTTGSTSTLPGLAADRLRWTLVHSRAVIGVVLVLAAVVWAIARGLHYYGASPVDLLYDLDQPPYLLLVVSGWLWYRSRRR